MRIVTLEEHISFSEMVAQLPDHRDMGQPLAIQQFSTKLGDIGGQRLQSMDDNRISLQVLSVVGPGANLLDRGLSPAFAAHYNDLVARQIVPHGGRFTAFAHLPMTAPDAAANELERTVKVHGFKGALINGLTNDEFPDHPRYAPLLTQAMQLDVPIYLHPASPPAAVADAYYSNLPGIAGSQLALSGWGWHS